MSKIISVSGQKGGCGKSSVTVVMASMLAYKYGKKVLVIDADTSQHTIKVFRDIDIDTITPMPTGEKDANGEDLCIVQNWEVYDAVEDLKAKGISSYEIVEARLNCDEIIDLLEKRADDYDFVLLDLPGNVDNQDYFKVIRNADAIFVPFVVDPADFNSNFAFSKLLHDRFLQTENSNIKDMYFFWNRFDPNVRKTMLQQMQEILKREMPKAVEIENKIGNSGAMTNNKCRNTLCAPIGKYESHGNIGTTIDEMCKKVL